jgi:transcriptional regulator with XRE-family HTH domain
MEAVDFGKYLKSLRKERKLTIQKMSDISDVSNPYISQLENGLRSIPSKEVLIKLSKALGIDHKSFLSIVLGREFDEYTSSALNDHIKQIQSNLIFRNILAELDEMAEHLGRIRSEIQSLIGDSNGQI